MSEGPDPRHVEALARGASATAVEAWLTAWLETERRRIERQVFDAYESQGSLDAETAIQAWLRLYEADTIAKQLRKAKRAGEAAGEALGQSLKIT